MSKKYSYSEPFGTADMVLRFGTFGAVCGGSLAAGTALAAHRQGVLSRDQVVTGTIQASLKAGLATAAGAALAAVVGGPPLVRLALMAAGSAAAAYALSPCAQQSAVAAVPVTTPATVASAANAKPDVGAESTRATTEPETDASTPST